MKRRLAGSLDHITARDLLRVLAATSPSGTLELETEAGVLRLAISEGRVPAATAEDLEHAATILESSRGRFLFEPGPVAAEEGLSLPLAAFAEAAETWASRSAGPLRQELDFDRLLSGTLIDFSRLDPRTTNIHVLPTAPLDNPLDDLLADLESHAPHELLFTQVGVISDDPRPWRGPVEGEWRRRGWQLRPFRPTAAIEVENLDVVIVYQHRPVPDPELLERWIELIRQGRRCQPPVPVIWVGPLSNPALVHRLVDEGAAYLLPAPHADSGETMQRLTTSLGLVVDRQLRVRQRLSEPAIEDPISTLVEGLLADSHPEHAVGSLLQIAAGTLDRGAVLKVEDTAIRSRAGFGYPLARELSALPRGLGLLERVIRSGEPLFAIDPEAGGAREMARVLGVDHLERHTVVIPLAVGSTVHGLLVGDRAGDTLPDLGQLVQLIQRLGAVAVES